MINVLIIDPGHHLFTTRGKRGNGYIEAEGNIDIAHKLYKMLIDKVDHMHFTHDGFTSPFDEGNKAGQNANLNYRAKVEQSVVRYYEERYGKGNVKFFFVSIHSNANEDPNAKGYSIHILSKGGEAEKAANMVYSRAKEVLDVGDEVRSRGIKESNFAVLRETNSPAILPEVLFYTNPEEAEKLKTPEFRTLYAKHLALGICDYFGIDTEDKKEEVKPQPTPQPTPIPKFTELKYEDTGDRVKELEIKLQKLGLQNSYIDDYYGTITTKAVKQFQQDYGLTVTGNVDKETWDKIDEVSNKYTIEKPNKYTTILKIKKSAIEKCKILNHGNSLYTLDKMYDKANEKPDFMINGGLFQKNRFLPRYTSLNLLFFNVLTMAVGVYSRFGLMMYEDGSFKMDWYKYTNGLVDMIGGSPAIIIDGKKQIDKGKMENSLITARHPRSAVGINDEYLFLVAIDGRQKDMPGMNIDELYELGVKYGMTNLISLDGGGSTRMHKGKTPLHSPTENRPVHNAIGIYLK